MCLAYKSQDYEGDLTKSDSNAHTPPAGIPQRSEDPSKEKKKSAEKWRSLSQEKQMKLYENTVSPSILQNLVASY